jgi:hypothetical protein
MPTAAALLMIATVLGSPAATEPVADSVPAVAESAETVELEPLEATQEPAVAATGAGDPLYDRLFSEPTEASAASVSSTELPQLPPWIWLAGMACLGGLYYNRKRKGAGQSSEGQVEVLGHTRMGAKSRLTVIRVAGEDGKMRRLLVSTGDGAPSLVAELGSEADEPAATGLELPSPAAGFSAILDEVALEDEVIEDGVEAEPEGIGQVPPPKVPVWNETPEEFASAEPAAPAVAETPAPADVPAIDEPPAAPTPLAALDRMLGDGDDAPEMVMDVSWDPETGWKGLPDLDDPIATDAATEDEADVDEEESWDALLDQQAETSGPLDRAGLRPASRAAFETLLSRSSRPTINERARRVRPAVHTVKPLRPWQQAPQRRTPYDDVLLDEPEAWDAEPELPVTPRPEASRAARSQELSRTVPAPRRPMRSAQEVHDLVAEVLEERDGPAPRATENKGNGVVELARYLRRQVAP